MFSVFLTFNILTKLTAVLSIIWSNFWKLNPLVTLLLIFLHHLNGCSFIKWPHLPQKYIYLPLPPPWNNSYRSSKKHLRASGWKEAPKKISNVEQWWRCDESTRLPAIWPGFDFQTQCHMWVEFVGSLLCSKRFSPSTAVFPSPHFRFSPVLHLIESDFLLISIYNLCVPN